MSKSSSSFEQEYNSPFDEEKKTLNESEHDTSLEYSEVLTEDSPLINTEKTQIQNYKAVDDNVKESGAEPRQLFKLDQNEKPELDLKVLEKILLSDSVRDKPVVVISIAGDYRKGKSFMLNFLLRYLQSGRDTSDDWLEDIVNLEPLKGFNWRNGSERATTGIVMWSQPYFIEIEPNKEVAVLLIDTQGSFDCHSTFKENVLVFALSTIMSSVQVFNQMRQLQWNDICNLEIFTEYGRMTMQQTDETPFQKLIFLIRDWCFDDYEHGQLGGRAYLDKTLKSTSNLNDKEKRLREQLYSCYNKMECFLMPYPGKKVCKSDFNGSLAYINADFKQYLKQFVALIFDKNNIVIKQVGGQELTARDLYYYIENIQQSLKKTNIEDPMTIMEANAEVSNLIASEKAKKVYIDHMDKWVEVKGTMSRKMLEKKHIELKEKALDQFKKSKKLGEKEFSPKFQEKLENAIQAQFEKINQRNNHNLWKRKFRNIVGMAATALVSVGAVVGAIIAEAH